MHETAGVCERNQSRIDDQKGAVTVDSGKQQIPGAHQQDSREHHGPRAVAVEQVTDNRPFDGAFGTGKREREGRCCATEIQFLAERQEKDGKAVAVQSGPQDTHGGSSGDHAPAVEQPGKLFDDFADLSGYRPNHFSRCSARPTASRNESGGFTRQKARQSESPFAAAFRRRSRAAPASASIKTRVSSQPTQAS